MKAGRRDRHDPHLTADSVWATPITDQAGQSPPDEGVSGYRQRPRDHHHRRGSAERPYDVYVYVDGDNGSASRTGAYQLSGTGITTTSVTTQSG